MNPMSQNNNQVTMIRNLYSICQHSNNPMQLMEQMANQNPQLMPYLNMMKQGMTPEQLFKSACQSKGIDPNGFMNDIRNITGNSR